MKLSIACLALLLTTATARADEGMWLYNQPPLKQLKERYAFEPTSEWLAHLQKASIRIGNGGSGSFVSSRGLVMTNHHVAAESIQKLSTPQKDLVKLGFYAATPEQELKCPDLELNVLESIEDVTARVKSSLTPDMTPAQAEQKRRSVINEIEQQSDHASGLKSEVVTLFRGGAYHLYRYHRYDDVRLVFAPEVGTAFFGGDPDNFEYPRHCLDVTFLRVYEQGKPIHPQHFLRWGQGGVKEGDLVLASGHPARTDRLNTYHHLQFMRDRQYPLSLNVLRRLEVMLNTYSERSQENARQAQDDRNGIQNSRKSRLGGLHGLQDPRLMEPKLQAETALRKERPEYAQAWTDVDVAVDELAAFYERYYLLELNRAFESHLYDVAHQLVRYVAEREKPNAERLRDYAESRWETIEQDLFAQSPLYPAFETTKLSDSLALLLEMLGPQDSTVQKVLQGRSPRQRAYELVSGTKLAEVATRRRLAKLSFKELQASDDPMIQLALKIDPEARQLRQRYDQKVSTPLEVAYSKIAQARLAARPDSVYPDATFTLRLSYGKVAGYQEDGRAVAPTTTLKGLYDTAAAHSNEAPFVVPERWKKARSILNLATPFNFVCTADIVGGNSGSPLVNRAGEVVGLIFDGNLPSLVWDFAYTDEQARSLALDTRAIQEALTKVYACPKLIEEILAK